MRCVRPAFAADPLSFGRREIARPGHALSPADSTRDDIRLFATSYAVGFLFVFMLIV